MAVRNTPDIYRDGDREYWLSAVALAALASKRRMALEWLGDRHILHRASTFKPTVPAFTVRNLAARRSALE